jgi:hypothetical protein
MIINLKSAKTEALLLFCRDLIDSYEKSDEELFDIDDELKSFVGTHIEQLKKGINAILQPNEYYIRNMTVSRIRIIVKYYNFINKQVSKKLQNDARFNPSMLCFSMLATWFKELDNIADSKEFVFFSIYPYGDIYDSLLIHIKDSEYKKLNIFMIQIAEDIMIKLNKEK